MRIIENKEIMQTIEILTEVRCNCCGENIQFEKLGLVQQLNLSFEYGSEYENQKLQIDMCEDCLTSLMKTFKIVPSGFMGESAYIPKFITDHKLHQELFEEWQRTGEWNYDDNPYNCDYDENYLEDDSYEQYNDKFENTETPKPTHNPILKIVR